MPLLLTHIILSQDSSEIYTEIVKGSVETVVGASLGRPMCSVTKKSDIKSPIVTCYPSKSTGLYMKSTRLIIFSPDFIPENTNGYTCNDMARFTCRIKWWNKKPTAPLSLATVKKLYLFNPDI